MKLRSMWVLSAVFCLSCESLHKEVDKGPCPPQMCTEEFRSVSVRFVDGQNNPVEVKNFTSVNLRTKEVLAKDEAADPEHAKGVYTVVNDSQRKSLSEEGDTLLVTGTHPTGNTVLEGRFVVKGGRCACHIDKLSGPEELKFN